MSRGLVGGQRNRFGAGREGLFKPGPAEEEPGALDVIVGLWARFSGSSRMASSRS